MATRSKIRSLAAGGKIPDASNLEFMKLRGVHNTANGKTTGGQFGLLISVADAMDKQVLEAILLDKINGLPVEFRVVPRAQPQ